MRHGKLLASLRRLAEPNGVFCDEYVTMDRGRRVEEVSVWYSLRS